MFEFCMTFFLSVSVSSSILVHYAHWQLKCNFVMFVCPILSGKSKQMCFFFIFVEIAFLSKWIRDSWLFMFIFHVFSCCYEFPSATLNACWFSFSSLFQFFYFLFVQLLFQGINFIYHICNISSF